jgi:hypothetical protein
MGCGVSLSIGKRTRARGRLLSTCGVPPPLSTGRSCNPRLLKGDTRASLRRFGTRPKKAREALSNGIRGAHMITTLHRPRDGGSHPSTPTSGEETSSPFLI